MAKSWAAGKSDPSRDCAWRGGGGREPVRGAQGSVCAGWCEGRQGSCCGIASPTMPGVKEWVTAVFDDFGVERSEVVGDEVIALDAAFREGRAFCRSPGTGSNCIGRAPTAHTKLPADGVRAWATRVPATGSASTQSAVLCTLRSRRALPGDPRVMEIWALKTSTSSSTWVTARRARIFAALAPLITNWPKPATRSQWNPESGRN